MAMVISASYELYSGLVGNAFIVASYEAWTAEGEASPLETASYEAWTGEMTLVAAPHYTGEAEFERWTAEISLAQSSVGLTISGEFEEWTNTLRTGAEFQASFEPMSGSLRLHNNISIAASYEAWIGGGPAIVASYAQWTAQISVSAGLTAAFHVAAMNMRQKGVTEFTNFPFNSFTKIGKVWYAAGDGGLYRLGDAATDNGTAINWTLRTGQHDDNKVVLKRIPEVILGLRSNGALTVRVHGNDVSSYDYTFPKVSTDTIRQHRVTPGKGMRSRWYSVELRGKNGADLELNSMQMNMTETTRRLGA